MALARIIARVWPRLYTVYWDDQHCKKDTEEAWNIQTKTKMNV